MRWVFDPEIEHPDEGFLYGYSVTADDVREYEIAVVHQTLVVEMGGNTAAVEQYLKWRESKGAAFLAEEQNRRKKAAEQWLVRREEERIEELRVEAEVQARRVAYINALTNQMLTRQASDASEIRCLITDRKIPYLVHFTRAENLHSIFESGILPRALLAPGFLHNDEMRLDGFPESSSLSVSFPNWQMRS